MIKKLVEAMKEVEECIRDLPREQWAEWVVYLMEALDSGNLSEDSNKMLRQIDESLAERINQKQW